jgi:3-keto-disaccharide hydrolase
LRRRLQGARDWLFRLAVVDPQVVDPVRVNFAGDEGVFKLEDDVIHVSGEEFGCLTTKQEYDNYRLRLEVKWVTKKRPPRDREKTPRDSGILIHCVGPDKVWTKSSECQIQERDFGDFFLVLQSEGAEVFFRNITLTPLNK